MGRLTLKGFIYEQLFLPVPAVAKADLTGKTVMIIGANTGLGFEAAKHFATMNPARLILACRNPVKGEVAIERLKREMGYDSAELWIIDLAHFASVIEFADKFEKDGGRLDLLVQNAGIATFDFDETIDGWESTIQTNCLSLSLLALRLLPRMVQTSQEHSTTPRIVVVSSEVHFFTTLEKNVLESGRIWKTLGSAEYCTPAKMSTRYFDSKLLNVFFARAFNDRLPRSTPIIINSVNPGYCYSEIRRSFSGIRAAMDWLMEKSLAHTSEEGSRQLVWAAVGDTGEEDKLRGQYISRSRVVEASDFVLDEKGKTAQDNLWNEMIEILLRIDPKIQIVLDRHLTTMSPRYMSPS